MKRKALLVLGVLAAIGVGSFWYMLNYADTDIYPPLFAEHCADCHHSNLLGTEQGPALLGSTPPGGENIAALIQSIRKGHPDGFKGTLTDEEVKGLAIYIGERRMGQRFVEFGMFRDIEIPERAYQNDDHPFRIETVINGLEPAHSIAPLPDGSILLTEKTRGLSVISPEGTQSIITGTMVDTRFNFDVRGVPFGIGWTLDVAPHHDYLENGWIYLSYSELCSDQCDAGSNLFPASMLKVVRGRINDNLWTDVETILSFPPRYYTTMPDTAIGGRLAFDNQGHLHVSLGMKNPTALESQDLDIPHGKTHRVMDDGQIPPDNPFVISTGTNTASSRETIWTYGHRSPHGLEWNPRTGTVWNTEMGPRGGDEVNELIPGENYGWPYHSLGLEYSGLEVARHERIDREFDVSEIQLPLVDFTPSPAISSFTFYQGTMFPRWKDSLLLGTLKGMDLYRLVFEGNKLIRKEIIVENLARIRDIETGHDGYIYLLLESDTDNMIVRLVPATAINNLGGS